MDQSNTKFRLSCSLYELIEVWSMKHHRVEVAYIDIDNSKQSYVGVITNVYSRDGVEEVVFDDELILPTKSILAINDVDFK